MEKTWVERNLINIFFWAMFATALCGVVAVIGLSQHSQLVECRESNAEIRSIDSYYKEKFEECKELVFYWRDGKGQQPVRVCVEWDKYELPNCERYAKLPQVAIPNKDYGSGKIIAYATKEKSVWGKVFGEFPCSELDFENNYQTCFFVADVLKYPDNLICVEKGIIQIETCLCYSDEPCLIDLCKRHLLSPEVCVKALYGVETE